MKLLDNLKITYKILLFMAIVVILATILAANMVRSMSTINDQSTIITQNWLPSVIATATLNTATSDFRLAEAKHVGTTDSVSMEQAETDILNIAARIADLRKEYEGLISSPDEKAIYDTFSEEWGKYMDEHEKFLALSKANRNEEAFKLLYSDSLKEFVSASDALLTLVKLNQDGAYEASVEGDEIYAAQKNIAFVGLAIMLVLAGICIFVLSRAVATPIVGITNYMGILSGGDLRQDVPFKDRGDEIGEMAGSLQVFKNGLVEAEELRGKAEIERVAKDKRQEKINAATAKFEETMTDIVKVVASASTELKASADTLAASAEETSTQSTAVSAASTETSTNVQTVAASAEQLSASIGEITQQVSQSTNVTAEAVKKARAASDSISKLLESAREIGEVTAVITDISGQTNLLALNATIEAARAGEAGKGFSVVAHEVKGLAASSAQSADQISIKIAKIQEDTKIAAKVVEDITAIVAQMNEISSSIAAAIEEQSAATSEITRNVNEASNASIEVDQNIAGVSEAAATTGAAASQLSGAAESLSRQSEVLKTEFESYIHAIRAA